MNTGNTIQIEVPDFDPDIDEVLPTTKDQDINDLVTQGSVTPTLKSAEKVNECRTPAPSHQDIDTQEVDWSDAIPGEIPPQPNQQIEQSTPTQPTQCNPEPAEIPQLEENSEEEQYQDLETYCCVAPVWLLSLNPFTEFRIWNNSSSSDVLYIQASISISPKYESKSKTTSHCHLLLHDCTNVAV